jgi:putative membrane protein
MKRSYLLAALCAALAISTYAEDVEDSKFVVDALRADIAEMRMGELAARRAHSGRVRDFGERLRADHEKSFEEISALASTLGVTVPTEPTAAAATRHEALSKLSGAEFDAAFVSHMVTAHEQAVAQFDGQAHANPNRYLATLAAKALPMLREHLAAALALRDLPPSAQPRAEPRPEETRHDPAARHY